MDTRKPQNERRNESRQSTPRKRLRIKATRRDDAPTMTASAAELITTS
ncbi:MAG TPA: hypothetical protein VF698_09710 [Thermoanaerobaculia bacterium]|jgi:hypothetical protein